MKRLFRAWKHQLSLVKEDKRFISERNDSVAELQYLKVRYHDPEQGMFIRPNWFEVTEPGVGTNRYVYSFNDPINRLDQSGNTTFFEAVHDIFSTREELLANNIDRAVNEVETLAINEVNYANGNITKAGYLEVKSRSQSRLDRYSRVISQNGGTFGSAAIAAALGALDSGVLLTGSGTYANRVASSALAIRISVNNRVRNGTVSVLTTSQGTFVGLSKNVAHGLKANRTIDPRLAEMAKSAHKAAGGFCGTCAEIHAISQARAAGAKLDGAHISTAVVASTKNAAGKVIAPCGSCIEVLKSFGIKY